MTLGERKEKRAKGASPLHDGAGCDACGDSRVTRVQGDVRRAERGWSSDSGQHVLFTRDEKVEIGSDNPNLPTSCGESRLSESRPSLLFKFRPTC